MGGVRGAGAATVAEDAALDADPDEDPDPDMDAEEPPQKAAACDVSGEEVTHHTSQNPSYSHCMNKWSHMSPCQKRPHKQGVRGRVWSHIWSHAWLHARSVKRQPQDGNYHFPTSETRHGKSQS